MESMTGYAFFEKSTDQFSFSIELKSLNSRYLETYVYVPKIMKNEENDLHAFLKKNFSRGKLELTIDIFNWNETKPISLNADVIKKYYGDLVKIQKSLKLKEPVKLDTVLMLEGLIQKERSELSAKTRKDMEQTLDLVVRKTLEMRVKEGVSIKKDLLNSLGEIQRQSQMIESLAKNVVKDKTENLKKKIRALTDDAVDDVRLYSEISILADKLDINEEIVRLYDHIAKFKAVVKETDQIGRKLDFLAQELFREINTVASKSNSSEISHIAVDVKNYIEKIREQCRNIV